MDEPAITPIRKKRRSSIRLCAELVKEGRAQAMVTAGNTGAAMIAAKMVIGTIPGVDRPALAAVLPNASGRTVLLDVGANVDTKPAHLRQFAVMGHFYAQEVIGIRAPADRPDVDRRGGEQGHRLDPRGLQGAQEDRAQLRRQRRGARRVQRLGRRHRLRRLRRQRRPEERRGPGRAHRPMLREELSRTLAHQGRLPARQARLRPPPRSAPTTASTAPRRSWVSTAAASSATGARTPAPSRTPSGGRSSSRPPSARQDPRQGRRAAQPGGAPARPRPDRRRSPPRDAAQPRAIAFVFPGQGSQKVGMGRAWADAFPAARRAFEEADEALGYPALPALLGGAGGGAGLTANTQPALLATSIAIFRASPRPRCVAALARRRGRPQPGRVLGAGGGGARWASPTPCAWCAGAASSCRRRCRWGWAPWPRSSGSDAEAVAAVAAEVTDAAAGEVCAVANLNGPGQTVIAGHKRGGRPRRGPGQGARRQEGDAARGLRAVPLAAHAPGARGDGAAPRRHRASPTRGCRW